MAPPPPDDHGHRPRPGPAPAAPTLRRHDAGGLSPPDGADAPFAAARLTALTHELANLLDGSMRCLGLAQRTLNAPDAPDAAASPLTPELARRIDTVHAALTQMAELVRSAMSGVGPDVRLGRRPGLVEGWTLDEALRHATDVMTPVAGDAGISITLHIDPVAGASRCGAIYAPVAAAIRNAIESIASTGRQRGQVSLTARIAQATDHPAPMIVLEVLDDGAGPPRLPAGQEDRVFELGFSTKSQGAPRRRATDAAAGIGLAMVRDVIGSLGGTVELLARPEGGAMLRMSYPMKAECTRKPGGPERC